MFPKWLPPKIIINSFRCVSVSMLGNAFSVKIQNSTAQVWLRICKLFWDRSLASIERNVDLLINLYCCTMGL